MVCRGRRRPLTDGGGDRHGAELDGDVGEDAPGARDVDDGPHVVLGHAHGARRQLQGPEGVVTGLHHHLGHRLGPGAQPGGVHDWGGRERSP